MSLLVEIAVPYVLCNHGVALYILYVCQYFPGNIYNSVYRIFRKPALDIEEGIITAGAPGRSGSRYDHRNGYN